MSHRLLIVGALAGASALAGVFAGAASAAPAKARASYLDNCSACHQPEGTGIQGIFPPLAGNALVKGDPNELVRIVLAGRNGMPAFRNDLTDEQLAAIVTHIRTSWGNGGQPVTPDFIAEVRARTNNPKAQNRVTSN